MSNLPTRFGGMHAKFSPKPQIALEVAALDRNVFMRRFEIRRADLLVVPPTPLQESFQFPKSSVYHFVSSDPLVKGPSATDPRLALVDKKMSVEHVRELTIVAGKPAVLAVQLQSQIDQWHRMQKRFRKTRDTLAETPNENTPAIFNYSFAQQLYRFTPSIFRDRYKWTNLWATVFDKIEACKDNPRNHFIFVQMPTRLPSLARMEQASHVKSDAAFIGLMKDPDQWMLYDLWLFLDREQRSKSLFSRISPEQLMKLDVVIEDAGRFMCLNIGKLNSWLFDPAQTERSTEQQFKKLDLQKRLLRGFMTLMENRSGIVEMDDLVEGEEPTDASVNPDVDTANVGEVETVAGRAENILAHMDDDLQELSRIEERTDIRDAETVQDAVGNIQDAGQKIAPPAGPTSTEEALMRQLDELAEAGLVTGSGYRSVMKAIDKAAVMPSPYDPKRTAREYGTVKHTETTLPKPTQLPDHITLLDKSMRDAPLKDVDRIYIRDFLNRDKVAMVQAIQKGGKIVTEHNVQLIQDALGAYEAHEIKITQLEGLPSVIRQKVVVVNEDNRIQTGNATYNLRRQRIDKPIRKISTNQVALASYYGKNFVTRTDKSAYDYSKFLVREINLNLIGEKPSITNIYTGDVFTHLVALPRAYTAIARHWRSFVCKGITFHFDYDNQAKFFDAERIQAIEALGMVPVGTKGKVHYALDMNNSLYECPPGDAVPMQSIEDFLDLRSAKMPVEFTSCRILGKSIPTGVVLAYYYGLTELIRMMGATVRQVPSGQRANLQTSEWSLVFDDMTLVFTRDDRLATMVLGGLQQVDKALKKFSVAHFDQKAVYFNVLESMDLNARYVRELDMLDLYFVDPITERVLIKMNEPTSYRELVKRSCEMLLTEQHKRSSDNTEQRFRGAERIAGYMYTSMIQGIREHGAKIGRRNARIEVHPYATWMLTMDDNALVQEKDINPIQQLKEDEAVTFTGVGGRSVRAMTRDGRYFDKSDEGVISEAGVDSKLSGVNVFTSAAPRFADMEGTVIPPEDGKVSMTSLLSTTAMLSPCITKDDMKRAGFASIQQSHGIACDAYGVSPVRTGFEGTLSGRVNKKWSSTADLNGVVKSITPDGMMVEYKDGSTKGYFLGRRYGSAGGLTFPHDMVTDLKVGDKFEAGDVIVYHKGFFKKDRFDPKVVRWMNGTHVTVALLESRQTHEDACSISAEFSKKMTTRLTVPKHITVTFDQEVHDLVKIGQEIKHNEDLCKLQDSVTSNAKLFSEETLNTLRSLSGKAPTAKVSGMVDNIVVYYHGDVDDMSASLREIVEASNRRLRKKQLAAGEPVHTGLVDEGYNYKGDPLLMDCADIVVYITHEVGCATGDKAVFALQLKTEISEVYTYPVRALNGTKIDAIFGGKSIFDRIVGSAFEIGTTTTLLKLLGKKAGALYKGIPQ